MGKRMLLLGAVVAFGATLSFVGATQAQDATDALELGVWRVSGQGEGAIKYRSDTGESFILLKEQAGHFVWHKCEDADTTNGEVVSLQIAFTNALSGHFRHDTKAGGVLILDGYEDPGLGLKEGDVLTEFNGIDLSSREGWKKFTSMLRDEKCKIKVSRGGEELELDYDPDKKVKLR